MDTDSEKALTRTSLINANDIGPRVCDPQKLRTPERLVHSERIECSRCCGSQTRGPAVSQFAEIRAIRVQLSPLYPCYPWLKIFSPESLFVSGDVKSSQAFASFPPGFGAQWTDFTVRAEFHPCAHLKREHDPLDI
jgi:hypothetical protein